MIYKKNVFKNNKKIIILLYKYMPDVSHVGNITKKHPLKESSFRGCKQHFFYLLALVLLQGTLKHIKKRQAHFTVIES